MYMCTDNFVIHLDFSLFVIAFSGLYFSPCSNIYRTHFMCFLILSILYNSALIVKLKSNSYLLLTRLTKTLRSADSYIIFSLNQNKNKAWLLNLFKLKC